MAAPDDTAARDLGGGVRLAAHRLQLGGARGGGTSTTQRRRVDVQHRQAAEHGVTAGVAQEPHVTEPQWQPAHEAQPPDVVAKMAQVRLDLR